MCQCAWYIMEMSNPLCYRAVRRPIHWHLRRSACIELDADSTTTFSVKNGAKLPLGIAISESPHKHERFGHYASL